MTSSEKVDRRTNLMNADEGAYLLSNLYDQLFFPNGKKAKKSQIP